MMRKVWILLSLVLAACASRAPVPVAEAPTPTRIEPIGPGAPAPSAATKTHLVKRGETLFGIARQYGVSPKDLAAWNGLDPTTRLQAGQTLRIAAPESPSPSPSPPAEAQAQPVALAALPAARPLDATPPAEPGPTAMPEKIKRTPKAAKLPYSPEAFARLQAERDSSSSVRPSEKPAIAAMPPANDKGAAAASEWAWPAQGKLLATFEETGNGGPLRKGIDIAGKIGDPVWAAASGKVILVSNALRGYGNLVIISHGPELLSVYAHNSKVLVKEGQYVARGQKIAEIGDTDASEPKLHFEIRQKGKPVDPLKFLPPRS
ncbi:MAG: peptidoglycan DD-metalloendopeptidase family protein [Rhodocyclaceae bacterium]|nr:peptidoglycan DD-metalloendopeptidase family protein [Rhodocyclaceae bacterium]